MFELPRFVLRAGEVVVEHGEVRKNTSGPTLPVAPAFDEGLVPDIKKWFENYYTIQFANYPVDVSPLNHGGVTVPCH